MNRVFTLGIAIFFALIGMALIGGERQVDAAFGCHGAFGGHHQRCGGLFAGRHHNSCCAPEPVCCEPAPSCCGPRRHRHHCGGGLFARLRARHNCCAPEPTCCAPVAACDTCGSGACGGCAPEPTCCAPEPTCAAPSGHYPAEGSYDAPPEAPTPDAPTEASPSEEAPPAPPAEA